MHVITLFDYNKTPVRPLVSLTYDGDDVCFHKFFMRGTGTSLEEVFNNISNFKSFLEVGPILVNDFKSHIAAFEFDDRTDYDICELAIDRIDKVESLSEARIALVKTLKSVMHSKPEAWRNLLANAQSVYSWLEKRPLYDGYMKLEFQYDFTFTGRSKTSGFPMQGTTDKHDIRLSPDKHGYFLHFDWISADLRIASIMSGDEDLQESFNKSDPYDYISNILGEGFSRSDCKIEFLKPIYSLSPDAPILDLFPQFQIWMKQKINEAAEKGHLESVLGRKFFISENRDIKSVFSGMIQGSVAHAMHNVLIKIYDKIPDQIITETHDSITLFCDEKSIKSTINIIKPIMLNPLSGLLDENPSFPFKVYVGDRWKSWKVLREYR